MAHPSHPYALHRLKLLIKKISKFLFRFSLQLLAFFLYFPEHFLLTSLTCFFLSVNVSGKIPHSHTCTCIFPSVIQRILSVLSPLLPLLSCLFPQCKSPADMAVISRCLFKKLQPICSLSSTDVLIYAANSTLI